MTSKQTNPGQSVQQVRHLTQGELAKRWNKAEATIERYRAIGSGPRFLKIGGKVLYRIEDIQEFERSCLYDSSTAKSTVGEAA